MGTTSTKILTFLLSQKEFNPSKVQAESVKRQFELPRDDCDHGSRIPTERVTLAEHTQANLDLRVKGIALDLLSSSSPQQLIYVPTTAFCTDSTSYTFLAIKPARRV